MPSAGSTRSGRWHAPGVGEALRTAPRSFKDKRRWAMDWYYPVLCGVVTGAAAEARLASRWDEFVVPERGVRCTSDRPWITAAETCELALALVRCGDGERAAQLLDWAQHLRGDDAAYWTGANFTDGCIFPPDEQPTWTAAAVVLADNAISGGVVGDASRRHPLAVLPTDVVDKRRSPRAEFGLLKSTQRRRLPCLILGLLLPPAEG